jgi:hypothetical protein
MSAALQKRAAGKRSDPCAVSLLRDKGIAPRAIVGRKCPHPIPRQALLKDQQNAYEIIKVGVRQIEIRSSRHQQQVGNSRQGTRLREEVVDILHRARLVAERTELNQFVAETQYILSTCYDVNHRLAFYA